MFSLLFSKGNFEGQKLCSRFLKDKFSCFSNNNNKNGSSYFGNQAALNLKESYVCFCLCVYMIPVLHIEQGLLQEISQKSKCFHCCEILWELQYFQRHLIPSKKGVMD